MDIFPSVNPQEIKINENGELFALKICTVKMLIIYTHLICYHILEKVTNKLRYKDVYFSLQYTQLCWFMLNLL